MTVKQHTRKNARPHVENGPQDKVLSGVTRKDAGHGVTLSGRCGTCGYLLTAPGHRATCG